MWDVGGALIQLELGSNAIKAFSSEKKETCDLLIQQIGQLRSQLAAHNIPLPPVQIRSEPSLPPDEYVLYMGILFQPGDCRRQSPVNVLSALAQQFHAQEYTYEAIQAIFQLGVAYLMPERRDYHKAVSTFVKAYYCAALGSDTYAIMINCAINICAIQVQNGNLDLALLDARRAVHAALADGFLDPYMKYHALLWLAVVCTQKRDLANALDSFERAFRAVEATGASQLKISALWACAYLAARQGDLARSTNALDRITDILEADQTINCDKGFMIALLKLRAHISSLQTTALGRELERLSGEYEKISRGFLYQAGKAALALVQNVGPVLISACVGSLLDSSYHFASGDIIYGNEVNIVRG